MAGKGTPLSKATDLQAALSSGGSQSGSTGPLRPGDAAAGPERRPESRIGERLRLLLRLLGLPRRRLSLPLRGLLLLLLLRFLLRLLLLLRLPDRPDPLCCTASGPLDCLPAASRLNTSAEEWPLPKCCSGWAGAGGGGSGCAAMPPRALPPPAGMARPPAGMVVMPGCMLCPSTAGMPGMPGRTAV